MNITPHIEDYLKSIYFLQSQHPRVTTRALAGRLGVSAPSASSMMHKLARLGLLDHERYKGARLTAHGEALALKILRAHRLWELYLVKALDLPWDQAHVEAERLEHALSDELADRLDKALGHPTTDPHGHPIPSRSGQMPIQSGTPLTDLLPGETGVVLEIRDETPELLRYLGELGIYPGEPVTVLEVAPFNGPIHTRIDDVVRVLGQEVAEHVMVKTETHVAHPSNQAKETNNDS
jgi:DtxR family Mn-dependent transcriptional regulator